MTRPWHAAMLIVAAGLWSLPSMAQEALPQTTEDGLELVPSRFQALYWRPGTSLAPYKRVVVLDAGTP